MSALFWGDAEPLAITFLISGAGALLLFVFLAWQQRRLTRPYRQSQDA
ncbi:MAG: hypothetical protein WCP34_04410 [Pseudomonadota bacterium]